jgi:NADH dehydrogenase FAD-containing subunit
MIAAIVAMHQASVVAWEAYEVLINDNKKRARLLPFRYTDLGELMTLGISDTTTISLGGLFQTSEKGDIALRRLVYPSVLRSLKSPLTLTRACSDAFVVAVNQFS